ncbi:amidohydrolase family protein [Leucobacter massiliensis]|uniref:Cytosine deaminase n=1 Tax=Leucobacter massiliensis TaxID=1686285 RepID=A0A2S9QMP2_9MICO|nr:amidohydrolase family protein [Leucobacter massiliensis]PRI10853.1 cytosine deaminase [Leucobacter massiliensis]
MTTPPPVSVYSASLVLPVTSPPIPDGAVAVREGRILHVGDRRWVLDALGARGARYHEEHWEGVLAPGLVNAHTHLQYTRMAEVASRSYAGFDDWGTAFDEAYAAADRDWAAAAAEGAAASLAAGVTAAADVVTDREALGALHDAGMHGIAYWEVYGASNADWGEAARERVREQIRGIPSPPGAGVSPHAPYSLEVQPLLELPDIVREEGLRLHIHLAEAHMEREFDGIDGYAGAGPGGHGGWPELEADSFRALRSHGIGVSSTQFVDHLGVLGPDCHIAHGVYVSAEDRALLRARGTSVALCPRSNEVIGLDMPPVAAYLREGNPIAVGTDSLSSSPSLDLMADVAALARVARTQGYQGDDLHQRLFTAATLGGAAAMGLHVGRERIGQLGVGAVADIACFELAAREPEAALVELVEDGAGRARRTILAGRPVPGSGE